MGTKLIVGVNDLLTKRPDIATQWHPTMNGKMTPQDVCVSARITAWFIHLDEDTNKFHYWSATIRDRTRKDRKGWCAVCHGQQINIGVNDLASQYPDIASEWHPTLNGNLTPEQVTVACGDKTWWQKDCFRDGILHEWPAVIRNRTKLESGCAVCHGLYVQVGVNDLATTRPDVAAQWHPTLNGDLKPQMFTKGAQDEVWWIKDCLNNGISHIWIGAIKGRTRNPPRECAICHGSQIQIGVNDLDSQRSDIAAEWHPILNEELTPEQVTVGSEKQVWWLCSKLDCAYKWETSVRTRTDNHGCPECAETGFKPNASAHLYLLSATIRGHQVIQFGISNTIEQRLLGHRRSGFTSAPIVLIPFSVGLDARATEVSLINLMKEYEIPSCSKQGIRFDGSTEAFIVDDLDEDFLEELQGIVGLVLS